MAEEKRFVRPSLKAIILTLPVFLLLIGLGTWQVERLEWKENLISDIQSRTAMAPVALPAAPVNPAEWRYRPVRVTGVFEHDKEIQLLANRGSGRIGYEIITPLRLDDGSYVLVDRGWVPETRSEPEARSEGQVTGEQTIIGYLRESDEKPWAVPANRPDEGLWLYANLPEMTDYLGIEAFPMFLQADDAPNPGGLPQGGQTRVDLPNNHLQYVITWYGLALALAVVFVVYHIRPANRD